MNPILTRAPLFVTLAGALALLAAGPIAQPPHYHDFADHRSMLGVPNALDVLSNAGFALAALWGLLRLWPARRHPALARGWAGYLLFLVALALTAAGSSYYHLAPDNDRLVWDRLPIALACAGLLAAVWAESRPTIDARFAAAALAAGGVLSVAWWYATELRGAGDLRPYLLLQGMPLALIPLWQWIHEVPREDRLAFGVAIALYVAAKLVESLDHKVLALTGAISGHTIKHLLATAAALVVVARLIRRTHQAA